MAKNKKSKGRKSNKGNSGRKGNPLKGLAESPMVAELMAAALSSTASALKDSRRAQAIASDAHDKLTALAGDSKKGNALWQLALDVGRQALDTLSGQSKKAATSARPAAKSAPSARKKPAAKKPAVKKTAAKKPAAKKTVAKKVSVRTVAKKPAAKKPAAKKPVAKKAVAKKAVAKKAGVKRVAKVAAKPARKPSARTTPAAK
ncbi:MAG: hypothetical protein ABIW33_08245 [Sphingomicrobium sp.]